MLGLPIFVLHLYGNVSNILLFDGNQWCESELLGFLSKSEGNILLIRIRILGLRNLSVLKKSFFNSNKHLNNF